MSEKLEQLLDGFMAGLFSGTLCGFAVKAASGPITLKDVVVLACGAALLLLYIRSLNARSSSSRNTIYGW